MKVIQLEQINERLRADPAVFAAEVDDAYQKSVQDIAEDIYAHAEERPFILLSGPSGSGKTSSAKILEHYLDLWGCETHTLSMDNYFSPFSEEEKQLVKEGKIDLEAPARMDIPFLNEQLNEILAGRPVDLPKYDFVESRRVPLGETLTRKPGELVLLEGIHALNPDVISLPEDKTNRVYVSVRTRVALGEKLLHPSWLRLIRRLLRDRRGRARSFTETLEMFDKVQRGEKIYITPYKHRANYELDTFHAYELSAYRFQMEEYMDELLSLPRLEDLALFLVSAEPFPEELIPRASLIREFTGRSEFTD